MIEGLTQSGAIPTLERTVQFTAARHKTLVNNVANLSTPHFQPRDLDPEKFQAQLREAVERRRQDAKPVARGEPLMPPDSREVSFDREGLKAEPQPSNENLMFHDRNNRSLERQMQHLAENRLMHETGVTMLKNEFDLLNTAIRERL